MRLSRESLLRWSAPQASAVAVASIAFALCAWTMGGRALAQGEEGLGGAEGEIGLMPFAIDLEDAEEIQGSGAEGGEAAAEAATPVEGTDSAAKRSASDERLLRLIEEASGARGADKPGLKKRQRRADENRARSRETRRATVEEAPRWVEPLPGWGGYPWSWGWYPWYGVPQTRIYRSYPPSITHVPRLGLQYNYPYALQMGIRIPDDSDPLNHPPNLGPFVGVVQAAKEELRRAQEAGALAEPPDLIELGIAFLQEGEYGKAGKVLLPGFERSDDPAYPLLLAEVFFALGKPAHAEALLRYGLQSKQAGKTLPDDVASHFPSREVFETKVQALPADGTERLLRAYVLIHSKDSERGMEILRALVSEKPDDVAVATLYRHALRRVLSR